MKSPKPFSLKNLVILSILFYICGSQTFADGFTEDVSPKEIEKWRKDALQGDAGAQYLLGCAYTSGQGVPKDGAEAVKWLLKAAEQNHGDAQATLGIEYVAGMVVPKDLEQGVKWIRKAAEQGNSFGQLTLGALYRDGEGVPKDDEEAFKWFKKSATQGDAEAQRALGSCYRNGIGVSKNPVEAAKWLSKAADQGESKAQYALGYCYAKGEGVPKHYLAAYMWFNLSAAAGIETAATVRDGMAKLLTPGQIAEAQKMSREWKPKKGKFFPVQEVPDPKYVTDPAMLKQLNTPDKAPVAEKQRNAFDDVFVE